MELKIFGRGQEIYDRVAHIWQVLVPWVTWEKTDYMKPGLITYSRLAKELGYSEQAGRTLTEYLELSFNICKINKIPAINLVVVERNT